MGGCCCFAPGDYWDAVDFFRRAVLEKRPNYYYIEADEKQNEVRLTIDVSNDKKDRGDFSLEQSQIWWKSWFNTGITWDVCPDQLHELQSLPDPPPVESRSRTNYQPLLQTFQGEDEKGRMERNIQAEFAQMHEAIEEYALRFKILSPWKGRWNNAISIQIKFVLTYDEHLDHVLHPNGPDGFPIATNSRTVRLGPKLAQFIHKPP